jgi:simple sugar transport system permease protein
MRELARLGANVEEALLPPVVALLAALVAGDLLMLAYGEAPGAVWSTLLEGT